MEQNCTSWAKKCYQKGFNCSDYNQD